MTDEQLTTLLRALTYMAITIVLLIIARVLPFDKAIGLAVLTFYCVGAIDAFVITKGKGDK